MVKQTMVHLTEELIEQADREAARLNISRSALVRQALTRFLASSTHAEHDRLLEKGYKAHPQAEPDDWGTVTDLTEATTREMLARVTAEERRAGHEPW
ncbi:MAG: CopG family transcriptional regulator [Euzebya sp.]